VDVEITWRVTPFAGASGQGEADKFETDGVNIRGRKPVRTPGREQGGELL
jgi:hypothetical protein